MVGNAECAYRKMAESHVISNVDSVFNSELKWSSRPVVFHRKTGVFIKLSKNRCLATRRNDWFTFCGIVFTEKPVSLSQMLKVTVMKHVDKSVNKSGLELGFTGEDPETSTLTQRADLLWQPNDKHLVAIRYTHVESNKLSICALGFNMEDITKGQSIGILVTIKRDLHWFVDDKWRGVVNVDGYPLDKPMWGVMNLFGICGEIRAEICSVSEYPPSSEAALIEMGLVTPTLPQASVQQLQKQNEDLQAQIARISQHQIQTLQHQLTDTQQQLTYTRQQLTDTRQQLTDTRQQLSQANERRQRSDTENQQLIATLRQQNDVLQRRVASLSAANRSQNSQEVEFWQVSPEEVTVRGDEILGGGAWGYVAKGTFRGTPVAVKRVYPSILQMSTVERICREIRTMAQIRHPNLVLFIAAVLSEQTGPMIVTELLDTSLRSAYQTKRVGRNKRKIFGDVSSALVYLHGQREPIIHRDVSSANVLLASQPNDTWLAKLADFGSANLARYASTPGEGAILYTAPEAYPHSPTSPTPRPPQTTKIDVYSFGVVACEVVTGVFPESDKWRGLLERVGGVWPQIHPLITSCVSHSPQDRPTMDSVLSQIKQLDWEP